LAEPHPSSPPAAAPGPSPGAASLRRWRRFAGANGSTGYFVIAFTAFLLALLWGAVAYQIDHDRLAVLETAQVNNRNLARAYSEHVVGALQLLDQALLRIKNEYENKSANPEFLLRLMNDSNIDARAVPIGITDAQGNIVASNLGLVDHAQLPQGVAHAAMYAGDREYFRAHVGADTGAAYVGPPITSRITGKGALAVSRRLNNADGSFAGVVFASFDPDFLSGFFADLAIGKNSSFAIIGEDMVIRDMIRGSGRATDLVGKSLANAYLPTALARAPSGDYEAASPLDHLDRIYAYRSLPNYGLIVIASVATSDVFAGFDQRRAWMIWAGVALSSIFIAAAVFQLRRIVQTRRYQIALNRSNEKLGRAQRLAEIGSFEHDASTGKAEWSEEMFRILGIEKTDALPGPETLIALIHPEDRDMFRQHRARELAGQSVATFEYRIIRPDDGAERIVRRESAVVFDNDTHAIRRFGTLQDITELRVAERRERELERQLLHSQKLEALGTLAGGIAHDLNNTLTPIMALSKLTARRLPQGDAVRSTLETIFAASEQARDLVQRVLAFSRRDKIEKVLTSPSKLVGDALVLLRATLPSSIQLRTAIAEVPLIFADSSQIHQVVTNLVANAAQAIGEKQGTITVTLERAGGASGRETVRLAVGDTGKGMDEATQRRIFEPFFTTKEVGQGTGLGLAIIEGIVNDHGGRIEVHSELGKGSRFDIFFPLPVTESAAA
jgi:PAS domain S-box-containing protein